MMCLSRWFLPSVFIGMYSMISASAHAQLRAETNSEVVILEDTNTSDPHLARSTIWQRVFDLPYDPETSVMLLSATDDPTRWVVSVGDGKTEATGEGFFQEFKQFLVPDIADRSYPVDIQITQREVVVGQLSGTTGIQLFVFGERHTATSAASGILITLGLYGAAESPEEAIAQAEKHYAAITFVPPAPPEIPPNCPYPDCLALCDETYTTEQGICDAAWVNCAQAALSRLDACTSLCRYIPIPNYGACLAGCFVLYGVEVTACDIARQRCLTQAGRHNLRCIRNCQSREP